MDHLPSGQIPLNQHSLGNIELWLGEIGASRSHNDPSVWIWVMSKGSAEIRMEIDQLTVTWNQEGEISQFSFPYGLSRNDIHKALIEGP